MDVTVTRRYKGQKEGSGETNIYTYSTVVNTPPATLNPTPTWSEDMIFYFNETATPEIIDYDTLYAAVYGPHPKFLLIAYIDDPADTENTNEQPMQDVPIRECVDGVLTHIIWDLSEVLSGKIIMSK